MQHLELIGIGLAHEEESLHRLACLILIDLAHGKADMDEYPVARRYTFGTYQRNAYIALHSGNFDFGNIICVIHYLYDLTWNTKTHIRSPFTQPGVVTWHSHRVSFCLQPSRGHSYLTKTYTAIVRRYTSIYIDLEGHFLQAGHQLFKQQPVLEYATAQSDNIQCALPARFQAGHCKQLSN